MPEATYDVGVRLKADGSGLVGETKQGVEALKSLEDQAKRAGAALGEEGRAARAAADEHARFAAQVRASTAEAQRAHAAEAGLAVVQSQSRQEIERKGLALAGLGREVTSYSSAMRGMTGEAIAATAAKTGLQRVLSGLMRLFLGPAGYIALLGSAAASWINLGHAAQSGGSAFIKTATAAAEAASNAARRHAELVGVLGSTLRGLRREGGLAPVGLSAFGGEPGLPAADVPSVEKVLADLGGPAILAKRHEIKMREIERAFLAARARTQDPERRAELDTLQEEAEADARRKYAASLRLLEVREPKALKVPKEESGFDRIMKEFAQMEAVAVARLQSTQKLTRAEERLAEVERLYIQGQLKDFTPAKMEAVRAAAAASAAAQKEARDQEELKKAAEEAAKAYNRLVAERFKELEPLETSNKRLAEHNEEIGLTTEQLDQLKIARAETALADAEAALALDSENVLLQERVRLLAENVRLLREGRAATITAQQARAAADEARRVQQEWDRTTDHIERSLIDSIVRGGKSARDHLVDLFRTVMLTPILQPFIRPFAAAASSVIGGITGSLFPGVAHAGGGLNLASNALSIGNFFSGGGLGFASGYGAGLAMPAAELAALIESGTVGAAGAGLEAAALGGFGPVGLALGGAALLGGALGLFGDDRKGLPPDPSSYVTLRRAGDRLELGPHAIYPGTAEDRRYLDELVVRLNALHPAARSMFDPILGRSLSTGGYSTAEEIGRQFIEPLIAQAKQFELELGVLRSGVPMAQVGLVQLGQSVETLGRVLGTGVRTLEDWRGAFLAAVDAGADAEKIAQWRALGTAIGQAAKASAQLVGQQTQIEAQLRGTVRGLPQQLGIASLEAARMSLATAESQAPLDRFAAARAFLGEGYARALGGDLSAVQAFPELLQSALGIGREVFASGPQFAELFREGNRMLNDLLAHQREIEADIVASVPATIRDAAADQIAEIRRQTKEIVSSLESLRSDFRWLGAAITQ
jgi:hypothetical protein